MSGPDVWGPHGWKFIHYVTLGYPGDPDENDKRNYYNFFETLKNVIPCSICGNNFIKHLTINPLTDKILSNKMSFIEWGINMHNLTNQENNKKNFSLKEGYEEIKKDSDDCIVTEGFSTDKNMMLVFMSLMSILLIVYIIRK